jgi:GT2 family glycosyltransferase
MSYDAAVPISTIVVNWNGRAHLETCLCSLLGQSLAGGEIILVDNASDDGSVALVRERFGKQVTVVPNDRNRGYAAGLNAGIRVARGRYLFALNNDTEVGGGCLAALVGAADRHPGVGACAPKILSYDDRAVIDNVGHLLYPDGLSRGRGRLEIDRGQYDREEEILLFSGCAVLLRREMLADVGLFDEELFAYCDDTDLGLRAQLAGWRCRFVPTAAVYHKYSGSSAHYSPLKAFLVERNRAWVAVRCLPLPLLALSPIFTALRLGAQAVGVLTRRGAAGRFASERSALELLIVLGRAWLAAARGLPRALRQRRETQRRNRIGTREFLRLVLRHRMGVREVALKD